MALMELFYRYCENNAEENVVIENKESSGEEAKVDPHQENDREKLEEADFPKRESEQHKESSQPPPKRHNSISEWENHMRQAEISKDIDRFKELNSMGRQKDTNNPNRRVLQRGKVTPTVRDLFRF